MSEKINPSAGAKRKRTTPAKSGTKKTAQKIKGSGRPSASEAQQPPAFDPAQFTGEQSAQIESCH